MKTILALLTVTQLAFISPSFAADTATEALAKRQAEDAAVIWVALVDAGKYAESWDNAGTLFKSSVSKANYVKAIQAARTPIGAVKTRSLKIAEYTTALPGAPNGEYVVIQFQTEFENKKPALEIITPMHEKDGSWKVTGYFIR